MKKNFVMEINCGCHCIKCGETGLESNQISEKEDDGYFDMHHTCNNCNAHFDHLEGVIFEACDICNYKSN